MLTLALLVWCMFRLRSKKWIVHIEGNIGVGKSTLVKSLSQDINILEEPVQLWQNLEEINFLKLYCEDRNTWAVPFQVLALVSNWRMQNQAKDSRITVQERSTYSVMKLFSKHQLEKGVISYQQFIILKNIHKWLTESNEKNRVFIYLKLDPEKAFARVLRRGREEEIGYNIEYLQELHKTLEEWMSTERCPVFTIDANQSPERVTAAVMDILEQLV